MTKADRASETSNCVDSDGHKKWRQQQQNVTTLFTSDLQRPYHMLEGSHPLLVPQASVYSCFARYFSRPCGFRFAAQFLEEPHLPRLHKNGTTIQSVTNQTYATSIHVVLEKFYGYLVSSQWTLHVLGCSCYCAPFHA